MINSILRISYHLVMLFQDRNNLRLCWVVPVRLLNTFTNVTNVIYNVTIIIEKYVDDDDYLHYDK